SGKTFAAILSADVKRLRPHRLIVLEPGDWRVHEMLQNAADHLNTELEVREDRHFHCSTELFEQWAGEKKELVLEPFYRWMRKREKVLLTREGKPVGGEWNFDKDNRETFGKDGPPLHKQPRQFRPDDTTKRVMQLVKARFGDHPGTLEHFDLPVTRKQALAFLRDFIEHRLPLFGMYEDALWTDAHFLFHSRLSAMLNVHLLNPRECVEKAIEAYEAGQAPINSVEGFVRQLLGWREFIRGIYWKHMPDYIEHNALQCKDRDVPSFFWDGQTDMNCVKHCMENVIQHGYAHHIQRLMVLGLFAQLLGVHPRRFHDWHMAMYVDAIDWVSLPNTLGMSQFGDGGIVGTKPYCATGNYINKMSNYCKACKYNYKHATGKDACPFTTLYW
ncbi:MAG: cryptochrome/photolyase family protein, partial [Rhodospirillales bacterium]|nr:cryptochrome/photolyase family protein [Rhodospirillales bacterium]